MKVYVINDYEEYGPESIRVATSIEGARKAFHARLDADWPASGQNYEYRIKVVKRFEEVVVLDHWSGDLGTGWGGLQLHILETE